MKIIDIVEQYILYRNNLGEKARSAKSYLGVFCRQVGKDIQIDNITPDQVKAFLYSGDKITLTWFTKYAALNGLYIYAINRGYVNISPLPKKLPKRPSPQTPYIYTRDELRRIFATTLTYKKVKTHINPYVVYVILVLIYSMGLRLNEAVSLVTDDVDSKQQLITIRETKFYKTRIIPYGSDLAKVINKYMRWKKSQKIPNNKDSYFFVDDLGKAIKMNTVEQSFQRIRKIANVTRTDGAKYQPRLHDLRHTFAVHRLTSWYKEKADVQKLLPLLSTYMGHTQLAATTIYLTMTADLLYEAGIRFKGYLTGDSK